MAKRSVIGGAAAALTLAAGTAAAQPTAISWSFSDLVGSYDGAGMFSAVTTGASAGDVTRQLAPFGTSADFDDGSLNSAGNSSVVLNITVSAIDNVNKTADGAGTIVITDADGDTLSGSFAGQWLGLDFGFTFLSSTGIDFSFDDTSGDGTFDGASSGSFENFDNGIDLFGAVSLLFRQASGGFFDQAFGVAGAGPGVSTEVDGELFVPAPASAALLAGMGLMATRRRRA